MTELGPAGRESIWLPVVKHRPRCVRSVRHDRLEPNIIFPFRPSFSVNKYIHVSSYGKEIRVFSLVPTWFSFYRMDRFLRHGHQVSICVSKAEKLKINKFGPVWVSYQYR